MPNTNGVLKGCEREGVSTVNVNHPLAAIHKEKEKCVN